MPGDRRRASRTTPERRCRGAVPGGVESTPLHARWHHVRNLSESSIPWRGDAVLADARCAVGLVNDVALCGWRVSESAGYPRRGSCGARRRQTYFFPPFLFPVQMLTAMPYAAFGDGDRPSMTPMTSASFMIDHRELVPSRTICRTGCDHLSDVSGHRPLSGRPTDGDDLAFHRLWRCPE